MSAVPERDGSSATVAKRLPVVLTVAFPYAPVGPKAVGGAEVICSEVEASLASFGFGSVVVAHAGSLPCGRLYGTLLPPGTITDESRAAVEAAHQANMDRALAENAVALVHMHGLDFHRYQIPADLPVLVTLHLPPSWYPEAVWSLPANYHLLCVSESQRSACPASVRERLAVLENGVQLPPLSSLRAEGRYALMLARICAEKNLHTGFDAARLAGMPVMLGGEVFPYAAHEQYFREEIQPRLTVQTEKHEQRRPGSTVEQYTARFVGPVAQSDKARILSRAACLLLPSLAPETSSLVAMEALAAGVPVIGMAVGAVPGIVEDGKTGFLVNPDDMAAERMAEAIRRLPELSRETCRRTAEVRFPLQRMLDGYAALYNQLALPSAHRHHLAAEQAQDLPAEAVQERKEDFTQEDLRVERVATDESLRVLEPEWAALWSADANATPFQHPAWLLPWWRQFGPDGRLHGLALRGEPSRRLVGFAPLYVYADAATNLRKLLVVGAGTTDYLDGLWASPCKTVAGAAVRNLLEEGDSWNEWSLEQLRAGSPLVQAAEAVGLGTASAEPTSVLDVAAELPAKIRANVGRYRRRAERRGQLAAEVARTADEALQTFEELAGFHSRRWAERGEAGVLSDPRVLEHHRDAIPHLLRAGLLRMFRLKLAGEVIGVLYALADAEQRKERRLYLYLIGFDQRFAELSPGTLLLYEVWRYARDSGIGKLDLLRGGEEYKTFWGATDEPTFALRHRVAGT